MGKHRRNRNAAYLKNDGLVATWFWTIPNSSKNKDAAYKFIKAMTSPQGDLAWANNVTGGQPCRVSSFRAMVL